MSTHVRLALLASCIALATLPPRPCVAGEAQPRSVAAVSREARSAVVVITCGDGMGTGFVALAPQYVVTAFHVVESARPIHIRFDDGSSQLARIKAVDRSNDLAVLELEHARPGLKPLVLDVRAPEVGAPAIAIGHPYAFDLPDDDAGWKGLLEWTVTTGVVGATSTTRIQTDALVSPGSSGGPLLGADGTVLGVVSAGLEDTRIGFAIRASLVVELGRRLDTAAPYTGEWDTSFVLTPFTLQREGRGASLTSFPAVAVGLDVVGRDRYVASLQVGMASDDATLPSDSGVFSREHQRIYAEATIGYRHLLVWGHHPHAAFVGFALGGMLTRDRITERTLDLSLLDPSCDPSSSSCQFETTASERRDVSWNLRPFASVWIERRSFLLGYGVAIDPTDPKDRTQQLSFAIRL